MTNIDRERGEALRHLNSMERREWHDRKSRVLLARADDADAHRRGLPSPVRHDELRSPGHGTSFVAWIICAVIFGPDTALIAAALYLVLRQRSYARKRNYFRPAFMTVGGLLVGLLGVILTILLVGKDNSDGYLSNAFSAWIAGFIPFMWPVRLLASIPLGVAACGLFARGRGWEFGNSASRQVQLDRKQQRATVLGGAPATGDDGYMFDALDVRDAGAQRREAFEADPSQWGTFDGEPVNPQTGEVGETRPLPIYSQQLSTGAQRAPEPRSGAPRWALPAALVAVLVLAGLLGFTLLNHGDKTTPAASPSTAPQGEKKDAGGQSSPSTPSASSTGVDALFTDDQRQALRDGTFPAGATSTVCEESEGYPSSVLDSGSVAIAPESGTVTCRFAAEIYKAFPRALSEHQNDESFTFTAHSAKVNADKKVTCIRHAGTQLAVCTTKPDGEAVLYIKG